MSGGRRAPLFGAALGSQQQVDPESLERDNDRSIDALGERVGALRAMTQGIHGEVESQHRLLDSMSDSMGVAQAGLSAARARFKRVFEAVPQRRRSAAKASGAAFLFFCLLYFLIKHH